MKRVSHLLPLIADMDNLREAFLLAVRGKSLRREVIMFREHLHDNLWLMHEQLLDMSYRYGPYYKFIIYDPKRRVICAAPFRERVVFHAMMRVCHPIFERYQTSVSYASRPGLGTYKALETAKRYSQHYSWFLKMDVVKYFDTIDHATVKSQLNHIIKDRLLLTYWDMLIDGYAVAPGKGLPIGNLTSQYFANHYMGVADHYAKEHLGVDAMVRYMDDVVIWGNDKKQLMDKAKAYERFLGDELKLACHPFVMNKTYVGLPFLGYVVCPHGLRLSQRSRHRYRQKVAKWESALEGGKVTQLQFLQSIQSMLAFTGKASSRRFLQSL